MLSRIWDVTIPGDNELAGEGDDEIRALKSEFKEHLEQDHQMSGILDPLQGNCDGYHNKVTLYPQISDPVPVTGTGIVYTKVIDGVQELFFIESDTGIANQLTENGVIKLNTLQNDLDMNNKSFVNIPVKFWNNHLLFQSASDASKLLTIKYPCTVKMHRPSPSTATMMAQLMPGKYRLIKETYTSGSSTFQSLRITPYDSDTGYSSDKTVSSHAISVSSAGTVTYYLYLTSSVFYGGETISDVIMVTN